MDPNIKQSIVDRLKQTNNVLVTVKKNPTVDHLAACIGLTLFLNKLGKHATAVFSGAVPPTIEFLRPEETIEKDTNSLRDFIIALDKSKADKLRYKVEDKVVKIFITPYRTSLSQEDLEFSQGDFNVDVVVAIGVNVREDLDQAIMAHGRILHDATIVSINNTKNADLGALNWYDSKASSLSEMIAGLADTLQSNSFDSQIATAFLTGIVAETERFSNSKTTAATMSLSAKLMAAGANQQLVARKLQDKVQPSRTVNDSDTSSLPVQINISHDNHTEESESIVSSDDNEGSGEIYIDEEGNLVTGLQDHKHDKVTKQSPKSSRMTYEPPSMGGVLTANITPNQLDPSIDPLSGKMGSKTLISPKKPETPGINQSGATKLSDSSLTALKETVGSPHVNQSLASGSINNSDTELTSALPTASAGIDNAREVADQAAQAKNLSSLASDGLHDRLQEQIDHHTEQSGAPSKQNYMSQAPAKPTDQTKPPIAPTDDSLSSSPTDIKKQFAPPPPVPPPMMPPHFTPPPSQHNGNGFDVPL